MFSRSIDVGFVKWFTILDPTIPVESRKWLTQPAIVWQSVTAGIEAKQVKNKTKFKEIGNKQVWNLELCMTVSHLLGPETLGRNHVNGEEWLSGCLGKARQDGPGTQFGPTTGGQFPNEARQTNQRRQFQSSAMPLIFLSLCLHTRCCSQRSQLATTTH